MQVCGEDVELMKVTSAVECVGVLSKHPHLVHFGNSEEESGGGNLLEGSAAEQLAHSPPPLSRSPAPLYGSTHFDPLQPSPSS